MKGAPRLTARAFASIRNVENGISLAAVLRRRHGQHRTPQPGMQAVQSTKDQMRRDQAALPKVQKVKEAVSRLPRPV